MRVDITQEPTTFKPITINIVLEDEIEVEVMRELAGRDITVSTFVLNNTPLNGMQPVLGRILHAIYGALIMHLNK